MAELITAQFITPPARPVYCLVRSSSGQIWNGVALVNYVTANYASYPLPMVQQGVASRYYTAAVPALPAGIYDVSVLLQASAAPVTYSEANDVPQVSGPLDWTGVARTSIASRLPTASYVLPLDAEGTQNAIGMADANLDLQLQALFNAIGTRLASGSYTPPPTIHEIADQVWDEALAEHLILGSTGAALNDAGSAGNPWASYLPENYVEGQAGYIIGKYLDVAVSTRAKAGDDMGLITPPEAAGLPLTLIGMLRRVFERNTNSRSRDRASGLFELLNAAGTNKLEQATQATAGTVDTISGAS